MKDAEHLLVSLRRVPDILAAFVGTVPESRLDLRRGEGFWTVAEHISHLAQVQPMLLQRLERFANEDRPEFVPYIPGKDEKEPATPPRMRIADALDQFSVFRNKQLALLDTAEDRIWKKSATHPEYTAYSFTILVRHILMHDYWHLYRMEELWLTRDPYLTVLA